ncbi:cupin domain-containing protein [Microbacterium sp.]|uniref:cupin domain-containing protein n=1 Tax=Microbacterium sp. TaxID=51671 RepID=UPI003A856918
MSQNFMTAGSLDRGAAEPFEVGVVQWLRRAGEGDRADLSAGYWFVTPADAPDPMVVVGHADETVHIVSGRVRIEPEGGAPVELSAGGVVSLNKGVPATWTVLEPTVEFFVYS